MPIPVNIIQPYPYRDIRGSVDALAVALDERDTYSQGHCDRVVTIASALATRCGLSESQLNDLCIAAHFHDIGKIGIPDAVLLKPARLTNDEWTLMKTHSLVGERLYKATEASNVAAIAPLIRHHHEAVDGSGYPDGLRGEEIPLGCRILLVADAYDSMTTTRPYHKARSHEEVMAIMAAEAGKKLDPAVFGTFTLLIAEHSGFRH